MLRIEGLHTYYGHGHILQGVNLEIPPGRIAAVLGRNGVGKTTTLRRSSAWRPRGAAASCSATRMSQAGRRIASFGSASATCRKDG